MLRGRTVAAWLAAALVFALAAAGPASAADKPLATSKAKAAAKRQASAKGRARYPFDTFKVSVTACKRTARFKVTCQSSIRGVASCLGTKCAPLDPGLYRETCSWRSVVTAYGKKHRQLRVGAYGFKCVLGTRLADDG